MKFEFPKGTKFGDWSVYREPQRGRVVFVIRRRVSCPGLKPKNERLNPSAYRQWAHDESELKKLCIRLNEQVNREEKLRLVVEIKHAYISPVFLDDYLSHLLTQIPDQHNAGTEFYYLRHYFLNFFITKLQMRDPLHWHVAHKSKWAEFLLSNEVPRSVAVKKKIVQAANRFMIYLHEQRPQEVPPLKFSPLSKAIYKKLVADRFLEGSAKERKFVKEEHWAVIQVKMEELAPNLEPFALLAYGYGLRRSETMGFEASDVRQGYLYVQKQLIKFKNQSPKYGPLKGRKPRKVPHNWLSNPTLASIWIKSGSAKLMHPDTLSDSWAAFMEKLGFDYDFHDLRHTWISRVIRLPGVNIRDVMLAAGHENIETTMRYLKDDRNLEDAVFIPEAS